MKLKDLIKLPELSGFKLISGEGGLDKEADSSEIIDFEFAEGIEFTREEMFYGHSIGLTSLMFARYKPELILGALKQLDEMGVSCLSYKPIFFKELPTEVIEYSESHDFPIFEITDDAFFEDIVLAIKKEVGQDMTETEVETALEDLIRNELSEKDADRLRNRICPGARKYLQILCFIPDKHSDGSLGEIDPFDRDHFVRYARKIALNPSFGDRVALTRFRDGGFLVLTRDEDDRGSMEALKKDVIIASGLPEERVIWGRSRVLPQNSGFSQAVKEAYWALRVCQIEETDSMNYDEIGVYRLIAPEMDSKTLTDNAHEYLRPMISEEDGDSLLETAVTYVLYGCDLNRAAQRLYCHKNTVRYRIKKIHELIDPDSTEESFRESLTLAVRVLLLGGTLKNVGTDKITKE